MSYATIVATTDGRVRGVHDWTEGFKALKRPRRHLSEDDILARAHLLERRGRGEEGLELIERFFAGYRVEWSTA